MSDNLQNQISKLRLGQNISVPSVFDSTDNQRTREDLLAEERNKRAKRRKSRIFRLVPTYWVDGLLLKPGGLAVLVIFLLSAFFFLLFFGNSSPEGYSTSDLERIDFGTPPLVVSPVDSIPLPDRVLAGRFGRPVGLSPEGEPVIEVSATGQRRELTPVERKYAADHDLQRNVPFVDAKWKGSVWNPGPRGWGMWWIPPYSSSPLVQAEPKEIFTRNAWIEQQENALSEAAAMVHRSLLSIESFPNIPDQGRFGEAMLTPVLELRDKYPRPADDGVWWTVPDRWVCENSLEQAVSGSVSHGCPPHSFTNSLSQSWGALGNLSDSLYSLGKMAWAAGNFSSSEWSVMGASSVLYHRLVDLRPLAELFYDSLAIVESRSLQHGFIITLDPSVY